MTYTFDEHIVSDLHKEARGYRPSEYWWLQWNLCSDAQKQIMWDSLCEEHSEEIEAERRRQEAAVSAFASRIQKTIELGATDEVTALRWILEGENFTLYDYQYGANYAAYHFDLPYENQWREQLDRIAHEKVTELYYEGAA
jgi:hypothetical protein